jgi:hypothetical protein
MNCKVVQKQITENLAAGTMLTEEVAGHREGCAGCQVFYEKERQLFAALDSGLQGVVNQSMPATLLPRVRAGMDTSDGASYRFSAWGFVAASAAVALVLSLGFRWNHSQHRTPPLQSPVNTTVNQAVPAPLKAPDSGIQTHSRGPDSEKKFRHASFARVSDVAPEVIVLAEEREAYANYLADHAWEAQGPVVALTVSEKPDFVMEIALLQIKEVEIQPLEGTVEN